MSNELLKDLQEWNIDLSTLPITFLSGSFYCLGLGKIVGHH